MTTETPINWIIDSAGEHLISQPAGYTIFLVHHGSLVECTVFYQQEQIGNKVKSLAKANGSPSGTRRRGTSEPAPHSRHGAVDLRPRLRA
jgi:hypothetical protein